MTRPRVRYFAYGSNMLTARLRERVPSATAIGIGQLEGHALRWDKRSWRDGSGKCDAEFTGQQSDVVWGVVFEFVPEDKPALDQAEGLGNGYMEKMVNILTEAGWLTAVTYLATDKDASLRPYHWYKALVSCRCTRAWFATELPQSPRAGRYSFRPRSPTGQHSQRARGASNAALRVRAPHRGAVNTVCAWRTWIRSSSVALGSMCVVRAIARRRVHHGRTETSKKVATIAHIS